MPSSSSYSLALHTDTLGTAKEDSSDEKNSEGAEDQKRSKRNNDEVLSYCHKARETMAV